MAVRCVVTGMAQYSNFNRYELQSDRKSRTAYFLPLAQVIIAVLSCAVHKSFR